jgi:D-alanyl-D-alanine carboxypeptidase
MKIKSVLLFSFLLAAVASSAQAGLPWAGVSPDASGSYDIPWLGKVHEDATNGWVRHEQLGWMYATGDSPKSVYLYKPGAGWLWTSEDDAYYFYSYDIGGWLYYCPGTSNPQWFYDNKHATWVRDLLNGAEVTNLDAVIASVVQQTGVPALACAVVVKGKIIAHGEYGAIYKGSTTPVSAASKWVVGSITKSMTCILAEKMVEQGLVKWDDKLQDLLPDITMNAGWYNVTLDELAHHTAGIDDTAILLKFDVTTLSGMPAAERTEIATSILQDAPSWRPGTKYTYSSIGYILIGAALERRAGKSYEELLVSQVLAPLGLDSYGFLNPAAGANRESQPWGHYDGVPLDPDLATTGVIPAAIPAGGVNMTIDDLARYISANLSGQEGLCTLMTKPEWTMLHYNTSDANTSYAFGWYTGTYAADVGPYDFSHPGSDKTFTTLVVAAPSYDMCIALATNEGDVALSTPALSALYAAIANYYGLTSN